MVTTLCTVRKKTQMVEMLGTSSIDCATTEPTLSIAYLKIKMAATMKRKKVSKNKKQTWRKHTDIKDVEEHLEEARREERTG